MPAWDPSQYLKFGDERTRPCRDLAARIALADARRIIDLGCGPGNSTQVLAARWPGAEIAALDSSPEMIAAARKTLAGIQCSVGDISEWARTETQQFDIVFSNATLHWVPDHATIYPKLFDRVAPAGALAIQVPNNFANPSHRLLRELASSSTWRDFYSSGKMPVRHVKDIAFYYELLSPRAARSDLWETEYIHVMNEPEAIVEWVKGTGLRPYLDALDKESDRERFLREYLDGIRREYVPRSDGRVLFPFRRMFLIAYRRSI